ncbi:MAG: 8-oxo-dGTP diphosphatase [Clostridia bacterium]|nr:8-oxo-dGTP diphosphatase [Clostridia bacterium]
MIQSTLCYLEKEGRYLMLHRIKKKQDTNYDKWIGIGGKFEDKESPEDCVMREVREETGLVPEDLRYCGIITFVSDEAPTEYMHLFHGTKFHGDMIACDEGVLEWIEKKELRTKNLWEGDHLFLDLMERRVPFFSLKLTYEKDRLTEAILNGKRIR